MGGWYIPCWLAFNIFSKHRQYIRLFCHFFPAISHQYQPIPTFFLGRPAAAQQQPSLSGSQANSSLFHLHLSPSFPLLLLLLLLFFSFSSTFSTSLSPSLIPTLQPCLSGQPSSLSAIRFFLPGISFLQLVQAVGGGSRLTTPPDFPPNSAEKKDTAPDFSRIF